MLSGHAADATPEAHWGYDGDTAPEHWGQLCPEFALCALGRAQSPIDISGAQPKAMSPVTFDYAPTPLVILNNGHTIQVVCQQPNAIELEGVRYELQQFHFHAPSEHTVEGAYAAMEVHLVHQSAQGDLAVVGVLMERGAVSTGLATAWSHLPSSIAPAVTALGVTVDPAVLLPADRRSYRYQGSLTTPPCSENVRWVLMVEPIQVSPLQVAAFVEAMALHCPHGNYRPVQPLNGRTVWIEAR